MKEIILTMNLLNQISVAQSQINPTPKLSTFEIFTIKVFKIGTYMYVLSL